MTIDWIHREIYLKPIKKTTGLGHKYSYGCTLDRSDHKLIIAEVFRRSAIESAGIQSGEEVLTLNGIDAEKITGADIEKLNDNSPSTDELRLRLKNQTVTLHKKDVFE